MLFLLLVSFMVITRAQIVDNATSTTNVTLPPPPVATKPATCLSAMWSQPRNNTPPTNATLPMAFIKAVACFDTSDLVNVTLFQEKGDWLDPSCAEFCANRTANDITGAQSPVLSARYSTTCYCLNRTSFWDPQKRTPWDIECCGSSTLLPEYCLKKVTFPSGWNTIQPSFTRAYELDTQCPTILSICEDTEGCVRVKNETEENVTCCVPGVPVPTPRTDSHQHTDSTLTRYYQAIIRWCMITVGCLAVFELILYVVIRVMTRSLGGVQQPLRNESATEELSERMLVNLEVKEVQPDATGDESCPICLDLLIVRPCVKLPCGHTLHTQCARDYVTHEVSHFKGPSCPMCRTEIVATRQGGDTN